MQTTPVTSARLSRSVIAVPPMARDADLRFDAAENARLIRHMEAGGVDILLYGGNANFYHTRPSEYAAILGQLAALAGQGTLVVPSAGPAWGLSMDQAEILRGMEFPTVMVLPHTGLQTPEGVATGLRKFAEAFGRPIVVYIKAEGYLTPALTAALVGDGLVSWIKYAIVREQPAEDPFLAELVGLVDPALVISGIGEQPAIEHLRDFRCGGFTTGCGCVAPRLSMQMLAAIQRGDITQAERLRAIFRPLEDLRNGINPVRVLHEAVALSGIAATGPHLPLLSGVTDHQRAEIASAAKALLEMDGRG